MTSSMNFSSEAASPLAVPAFLRIAIVEPMVWLMNSGPIGETASRKPYKKEATKAGRRVKTTCSASSVGPSSLSLRTTATFINLSALAWMGVIALASAMREPLWTALPRLRRLSVACCAARERLDMVFCGMEIDWRACPASQTNLTFTCRA